MTLASFTSSAPGEDAGVGGGSAHYFDGGIDGQRGTCRAPRIGDACFRDEFCPANAVCQSQRCRPAKIETTCGASIQCGVGACDDTGCVLPMHARGERCFPGNCASGADVCARFDFEDGGTCEPRPAAGGACGNDGQCQRTFVCRAGQCVPGGLDQQPCLSNAFCLEGACNLGGFCDAKLTRSACE